VLAIKSSGIFSAGSVSV